MSESDSESDSDSDSESEREREREREIILSHIVIAWPTWTFQGGGTLFTNTHPGKRLLRNFGSKPSRYSNNISYNIIFYISSYDLNVSMLQ